MVLKKFFGDKAFYKMLLSLTVPIMIQNIITNFVSLLDNIMVGALGTEQMSGVSIVNQLLFIFNLAIFGALSGAGIFTSQFYGKKDPDGIRYTVRYKIYIGLLILVVGIGIFTFFKTPLINLFLHESDGSGDITLTLSYAKDYLNVILWGLFPFCVTQVISSSLRETGETVVPMAASFVAVVVNCSFNWVLIFGKLGFPALGVVGAATATNISRYTECIILILYTIKKRSRFPYFKGLFKSFYIPGRICRDITVKGMPLLFNELFWSLGMTLLSVVYSLHGIDVVAGYSISSTVMNLANIAFISMGASISIIVGKLLGANEFEKAYDTDRKLITFSVLISIVVSFVVFNLADYIPLIYNTSPQSKEYAAYFIKAASCFSFIHAFANAAYFTIRSGGRTVITFLMDSVYMMVVAVPFAFSLYYVFHLDILVSFPIIQAVDIIKVIIGLVLIKKRVWLNNIVD